MATKEKPTAQTIYHCVKSAVDIYFDDMDGHKLSNLYELVLSQVEKPMLEVVMRQTRGNMTKAAGILGISRGALRKKLQQYGLYHPRVTR